MTSKRVRNLFKFGRAKSQSTTDLTEWSKSDEKLMKAVEHGEAKKVFSILSKKAMVPTKLGPRGHSIFHVACALGNIQIVEMLIKETDDVNDFTIQGNTCLQLAAAKGHVQVVQRLLQAGAEIDKRDSNNMTALHHAVAGLHHDCIQALLSKGADPRSTEKGGKTSLFYAAHRGDVSICKLLVDKGVDVNSGDNMQVTPLMIAAKEGNRDVCEFLLKRGANPNHPDREGRVAEHYAVASGHPELKDVFANAPPQASWVLNTLQIETVESRTSKAECNVLEEAAIHVQDAVTSVTCLTQDASPGTQHPADAVQSLTSSDAETMSYSEDEAPPKSVKDTSSFPTEQIAAFTKKAKAYKELESEHEQLSEEYHTLSIENLRLRDKLEFLQQQTNGKFEQDSKRIPQEIQNEIINLKNLLEEEKEKCKELEIKLRIKTGDNTEALTMEVPDSDSWQDSDEDLFDGKKSKTEGAMNDKQMMVLLRSQILTLRQENDQLKDKLQLLPNGYRESSPYLFSEGDKARASAEVLNSNQTPEVKQKIAELEAEKQLIKTELLKMKESTMAQHLNGALSQEEILKKNKKLQEEIELLKNRVTTLETDKSELQKTVQTLEEEKAAIPSDKLAVLNSHKLMQEVTFDEDGFVDGQDMTKEEFLQAQNEQVKGQCKLLTEELAKLRTTFDAILKAGDNLQADYDQLQAEKDKLHDQLEAVSREKEEVVKENEFLLSDGNALHEDLKKIVHELEKMQEKYKKISAEKEELQRQASAITIAGKVGEVARLLEEREKLQLQLGELEKTSGRLSHDNAILLEEVQSLQESNVALTAERDSLQTELEETEAILSQHDVLTQEYNQLEIDFNELLKDKDRLEQDLLTKGNSMVPEQLNDKMHGYETLVEERDILIAERDQLELTIQELSRENALLEEELQSAQSKIISLEANSHSTGTDSLSSQSKNAAHWIRTIEELSKEKSELEEELLNAQEQMTAMEVQMEATSKGQGQAVGDDEDVESLHASLSHLERTVTELSLENAHLEDELTSCREQLDEAQIALENRSAVENHNLSSADLAMQTLKQEKQDLAEMVESLQEKIEELLQNTSKLKNDVESLQNEKEGLLQTVAKFEERNTELSDKLVLMKSQLLGLEGEAGDSTQNSRTVTMRISMNGTETNDKGSVEQEQEIKFLRAQLGHLQQQLTELEQTHRNTISIYRTHLLSAVQGHMDPAVKEALYNIIEMRSMEQYC